MTDITGKHAECKYKFFKEFVKELEFNSRMDEATYTAEQKCNFAKGYHYVLFPAGVGQIMQEFEAWQDSQMLATLDTLERPNKIREMVALALEVRIIKIISKNALLNANGFFTIPSNLLSGSKVAYKTCNSIWKYAGDKSSDFNHYTKRGLLFSVYQSSKLFYFADNSTDHKNTKEFIKNALDNIINIASFKSRVRMEDIPILRLFS